MERNELKKSSAKYKKNLKKKATNLDIILGDFCRLATMATESVSRGHPLDSSAPRWGGDADGVMMGSTKDGYRRGGGEGRGECGVEKKGGWGGGGGC